MDVGSVGPNGVEEFIAIGDVHNLVNLKHTKETHKQIHVNDPDWTQTENVIYGLLK